MEKVERERERDRCEKMNVKLVGGTIPAGNKQGKKTDKDRKRGDQGKGKRVKMEVRQREKRGSKH